MVMNDRNSKRFPTALAPYMLLVLSPMSACLVLWLFYMVYANAWHIYSDALFMPIVMAFGSLVAGATPVGGGAVAYPAMTLIWNIEPEVARNFSLAIQSVGMTCAAYIIFVRKIRVEPRYLVLALVGGSAGMVLGTFTIALHVPDGYAKMGFVSLWASFGFVLFYANHIAKRKPEPALPRLEVVEQIVIVLIAVIGGMAGSVFGNGLDICTFSYVTLRYNLSEKVGTPTSVVLMASNAVLGVLLHQFVLRDFGPTETQYWLACIPVVCIGAPLGSYWISRRPRKFVVVLLYVVLLVQFVGACFVLRPTGSLLAASIATLVLGVAVFFLLAKVTSRDGRAHDRSPGVS